MMRAQIRLKKLKKKTNAIYFLKSLVEFLKTSLVQPTPGLNDKT